MEKAQKGPSNDIKYVEQFIRNAKTLIKMSLEQLDKLLEDTKEKQEVLKERKSQLIAS